MDNAMHADVSPPNVLEHPHLPDAVIRMHTCPSCRRVSPQMCVLRHVVGQQERRVCADCAAVLAQRGWRAMITSTVSFFR